MRETMKTYVRADGSIQGILKHILVLAPIVVIGCLAALAFPQATRQRVTKGEKAVCPTDSPKDPVERLWELAASGETIANWGTVARLFSEAGPRPKEGSVRVFSDYWWVEYFECSNEPEAAVVVSSHWDRIPGVIDSRLHFTQPPPSNAQAGIGYRVVMTTPPSFYWGPDGKSVPAKPTPEPKRWLIEGPPPEPFVTVTAAIRYVLEKRAMTTDPVIRKNADETLARLLKMH